MYNEEAHCEAVIAHACAIKYPRERLLIQVLDDSTKEPIKHQVDLAVAAQARAPRFSGRRRRHALRCSPAAAAATSSLDLMATLKHAAA
jgi:hypothetical protein